MTDLSIEFHSHRADGHEDEHLFLSWRTITEDGWKNVKEFLRKDLILWPHKEKHLENTGTL